MAERILYKYLDVDGGLKMLKNGNLQFTNATQLNDPFDCHPGLIDYSNANTREARVFGKELIEKVETSHAENRRDDAWICSLSKTYNSLLMWSYYNGHKGVCIGLDREKIIKCLSTITQSIYIGAQEMEVQYKELIEKPDFFKGDYFEAFKYQLSTKAKEWAHEEEVRLLLIDPTPAVVKHHPSFAVMALPFQPKEIKQSGLKKLLVKLHLRRKQYESVDWREWRAYPEIAGDCFESVYLGVNILPRKKDEINEAAKKLNPNIKIYQMKIDPDAFRLKEELEN